MDNRNKVKNLLKNNLSAMFTHEGKDIMKDFEDSSNSTEQDKSN